MASSTTTTFKTFTNKVEAKLQARLEKAKCKLHKPKTSEKTNKAVIKAADTQNNMAVVEPNNTKDEGQLIISEPKYAGDEVQNLSQSTSGNTVNHNNQDKPARRAARKQARKERWVTRCAAFKTNAKKIGEALFLPATVIGGIVFGPIILVVGIVFFALRVVLLVVLKILDLIFCGPVLACYVIRDG